MSLSFCILGSGSSGNCCAVFLDRPVDDSAPAWRAESPISSRACLLIDAGFSPRRTRRLLEPLGASLDEVCAILLTHLDSDHFHYGWLKTIALRAASDRPLTIFVHRRHRNAAWRAGLTARETALFEDDVALPLGARASAVILAHDDLGSVGYLIENDGHRLGYATDLGCAPQCLFGAFVNLHAMALESNYDPQMQHQSARPWFLKRRIMGGMGHLSNEEAIEAVREIERRSRLSHIALLHLSQECNCPRLVRQMWAQRMPHALSRLTIAQQRTPSPLLQVKRETALPPVAFEWKQASLFEAVAG